MEEAKNKNELIVDLEDQKIFCADESSIDFNIDSFRKKCLLNGLDDISLSLKRSDKISSFEKNIKKQKPWLF